MRSRRGDLPISDIVLWVIVIAVVAYLFIKLFVLPGREPLPGADLVDPETAVPLVLFVVGRHRNV